MFATSLAVIAILVVSARMLTESKQEKPDQFARISRSTPPIFHVDRIGKLVDRRI